MTRDPRVAPPAWRAEWPAPDTWPGARIIETHMSVLAFVGDRVYKSRKPVHFDFVDFTRREARQADCHREVELNRRLAPDVYLGVIDLSMDGREIDHVVVMRRLPEERRLATMVRAGATLGGPLRSIARQLATFHASSLRSPAIGRSGTVELLLRGWRSNFLETEQFRGRGLDPVVDDEIRRLSQRFLEGRRDLLDQRIRSGAICDGHGDLQAEDIFCLDDGPRILDCLEFDAELRHGDVLADLGFLAMDLERLHGSEEAQALVDGYREFTGDPLPRSLLAHYCARAAYIRAKVACLRRDQRADGRTAEITELHRLCRSFLDRARVRLVLVGGVPGSGKSTLAGRLADGIRATVLSSDEIRKERAGIPTDRPAPAAFGQGAYSAEATRDTYRTLLDRAGILLGEGESVVLDASWSDAGQRDLAAGLAERTTSDLTSFRCSAPPLVLADRMARRRPGESHASDATPDVLTRMSALFDPWPDASAVDTTGSPGACLAQMRAVLSRG